MYIIYCLVYHYHTLFYPFSVTAVRHVPPATFPTFLAADFRPTKGIMQRFIMPSCGRNIMFRAIWSNDGRLIVERCVNRHAMPSPPPSASSTSTHTHATTFHETAPEATATKSGAPTPAASRPTSALRNRSFQPSMATTYEMPATVPLPPHAPLESGICTFEDPSLSITSTVSMKESDYGLVLLACEVCETMTMTMNRRYHGVSFSFPSSFPEASNPPSTSRERRTLFLVFTHHLHPSHSLLNYSVQNIAKHVFEVFEGGWAISSMTLYFKLDGQRRLWLMYCSGLNLKGGLPGLALSVPSNDMSIRTATPSSLIKSSTGPHMGPTCCHCSEPQAAYSHLRKIHFSTIIHEYESKVGMECDDRRRSWLMEQIPPTIARYQKSLSRKRYNTEKKSTAFQTRLAEVCVPCAENLLAFQEIWTERLAAERRARTAKHRLQASIPSTRSPSPVLDGMFGHGPLRRLHTDQAFTAAHPSPPLFAPHDADGVPDLDLDLDLDLDRATDLEGNRPRAATAPGQTLRTASVPTERDHVDPSTSTSTSPPHGVSFPWSPTTAPPVDAAAWGLEPISPGGDPLGGEGGYPGAGPGPGRGGATPYESSYLGGGHHHHHPDYRPRPHRPRGAWFPAGRRRPNTAEGINHPFGVRMRGDMGSDDLGVSGHVTAAHVVNPRGNPKKLGAQPLLDMTERLSRPKSVRPASAAADAFRLAQERGYVGVRPFTTLKKDHGWVPEGPEYDPPAEVTTPSPTPNTHTHTHTQ